MSDHPELDDFDRDSGPLAQLVLPCDEDLAAGLLAVEETLLRLVDLVENARPAADTAGGLATTVDPERTTAAQPVIELTQVIPLVFPIVLRADVDQLAAVVSNALAGDTADDVADTVAAVAEYVRPFGLATTRSRSGPTDWLRQEAERVLAVLQVDHGRDFQLLQRLNDPVPAPLQGIVDPAQEKVVLGGVEAEAYHRVVDRCLAAWRPADPLARFLYKGP